jgi:hypothetical protein
MTDQDRLPFGARRAAKDQPADEQEMPTPVLHVGEVHAELRLHVTQETLTDLGSQIASIMSAATRQGFEHGLALAMGETAADADGGEQDPAAGADGRMRVDLGGAVMPQGFQLSEKDIARVRRAV